MMFTGIPLVTRYSSRWPQPSRVAYVNQMWLLEPEVRSLLSLCLKLGEIPDFGWRKASERPLRVSR